MIHVERIPSRCYSDWCGAAVKASVRTGSDRSNIALFPVSCRGNPGVTPLDRACYTYDSCFSPGIPHGRPSCLIVLLRAWRRSLRACVGFRARTMGNKLAHCLFVFFIFIFIFSCRPNTSRRFSLYRRTLESFVLLAEADLSTVECRVFGGVSRPVR